MAFISTKGAYGLSAMLELAVVENRHPLQIREIAERARLPQHYLEQLLATLRKNGLICSVRGAQGGYMLARDASQITVLDVLVALEGDLYPISAEMTNPVLKDFWERYHATMIGQLGISLEELAVLYRRLLGERIYYI